MEKTDRVITGLDPSHLDGQSGHHFVESILKCIFMNEKMHFDSNFIGPKAPINNKPALI